MVDQEKQWQGVGWAFPVRLDTTSGTIALSRYEFDIREAIRIILSTARGERVMRPDFGCGIHALVYDVVDVSLLTRIETEVREAINRYEPRVELLSVAATDSMAGGKLPDPSPGDDPFQPADGLLLVEIDYRIRQTNQSGNLVYPFYFTEDGSNTARSRR